VSIKHEATYHPIDEMLEPILTKNTTDKPVCDVMPLIIAFALLGFLFVSTIMNSALTYIGSTVSPVATILSALLPSGLIVYYLRRSKSLLWLLMTVLIYFALIYICVTIAGMSIDDSYDGNAYHKVAVGAIANGWNPFNSYDNSEFAVLFGGGSLWIDAYPKSIWILSASFYQLTGNIESGKAVALLAATSLCLLSYWFFCLRVSSRGMALSLALILAFNPVTISQIGTFYVDGLLGSFIIILILSLTYITMNRKGTASGTPESWIFLFLALISVTLSINTKFSGIPASGVVGVIYLAYFLLSCLRNWNDRNHKDTVIVLRKVVIFAAIALVLGFGFIGANTYLKNVINGHHILYPLMGDERVDIITLNSPRGFEGRSNLYKFLRSNFSESENLAYAGSHDNTQLKIPFSVNRSELESFRNSDVRIAGYGPLYSGVFVISFVTGIVIFSMQIKQKRIDAWLWLPVISMMLSILVIPELWWARYFPQLYLLPILCVAYLFEHKSIYLTHIIIGLLIVNSFLVGMIRLSFLADNCHNAQDLLAQYDDVPSIELCFENPPGYFGYYFNISDSFPDANISVKDYSTYQNNPDSYRMILNTVWARDNDY
jgi:4-amino-4-deoxy-L-arabinose transferase-like glycosyltransferase